MTRPATGAAGKRDFLLVSSLAVEELLDLLDLADELKAERSAPPDVGGGSDAGRRRARFRDDLDGASVALLFEKPSTRTRVSFDVGIRELGGHPVVLPAADLQLGRGETLEDTARVLSRYCDALVIRTFAQARVETLAAAGSIPVVNALTDFAHPCQALADLQTIREYKGQLDGVKLCYVGDGNNVAHSLLEAGAMTGMHVAVATPPGYEPDPGVVAAAEEVAEQNGGRVTVTHDPSEAAKDADVLSTDVWASMGQEAEADVRRRAFGPYRVDADLLEVARPDAIVMHCLPAHRGEEITADVLDGQQSVVWAQAENRLHAQKALLVLLLADR